VISVELAQALADGAVLWQPRPGDRFTITRDSLLGQVFWVSDLTIELHHFADQSVLGFNGTTEWALDSVPIDLALWLPREDQLRGLLGERFVSLAPQDGHWVVTVRDGAGTDAFVDPDAECAYALALLSRT
jgi:hypothetical protein